MLLWVTRSSPFNLLTAQRLRGMGHGVILEPLFDILPLDWSVLNHSIDLIVFTSVHGVRHHPYRSAWSDLPVFTVGEATAAAARRIGYHNVRSANGNLQDLKTLILHSASTGKRLIHFSAEEPAGDIAMYLSERGFDAVRRSVYKTVPRSLRQIREVLTNVPRVDGILVHSPKGGRRVAQIIAQTGWGGTVFCLSRACAEAFRTNPRLTVHSAAKPTERALMAMIRHGMVDTEHEHRASWRLRLKARDQRLGARPLHSANDNWEPDPRPA